MPTAIRSTPSRLPQTVLVLQGGGALGAYQLGVYAALHQRGIEPDWVIGTSIGAINAALIAGNPPARRLERLQAFWQRVQQPELHWAALLGAPWAQTLATASIVTHGVDGFFTPRLGSSWWWPQQRVGAEQASYYSVEPLRETLAELLDPALLAAPATRLTVGTVDVASGQMRYFDSCHEAGGLRIEHMLASAALPPGFAAVRIGEQSYWDGGIYSNTPIEAVLEDHPRRSSLIFAVNVWHESGPVPVSIAEALAREKDIQYASRHDSHIARQKQIHHLRRVIRELSARLGAEQADATVRELASWGCSTTMHIVHLHAPRLTLEDSTKDIDFSAEGIRLRSEAGRIDTLEMLDRADWLGPADELAGVIEHRLRRDGG